MNICGKQEPIGKSFRVQSKSGDIIESEWSNIKLGDGNQIGIGIDITERRRF